MPKKPRLKAKNICSQWKVMQEALPQGQLVFQEVKSSIPKYYPEILIAPYGCTEINKGGGGADIGPLNRALKTPTASLNPDTQRYFDIHHARSDVFEAVNKRELELGAVNMAAFIYLVDKYGL